MSHPDDQPRWRRLTPDARREAIIEAATRRFATRPYEEVSTSDIAADAGVNRGLIHHYIGTKRDLYLEVLRRNLRMPAFTPLVALSTPENLERAISEGIDAWLDEVERAPGPWLVFQRASVGPGRDPEVEALVQAARDAAIDEGLKVRFADGEAPPAVRGVVSALGALAAQAIVERIELERLNREQVRALLRQLALSLWLNIDTIVAEPLNSGAGPSKEGD
jgi:AcrR family transcriptional regulator